VNAPRRAAAVAACLALTACRGSEDPTLTQPPSSTATAVAWQSRSAAPAARQEVAATVAGGRVWVLGGLTAAGTVSRVDAYDPGSDRWERGPDLPVAVHHPMAATFKGEVVLIGGFLAGPGDLYREPSDQVLALRNGAWVDLPRLARGRGAGAAVVVGERLVVVGGRDSTQLVAPTETFDGVGWRDGPAIPVPRDHLAAVADDNFVYAVGGRLLSSAATSGAFERFDPATNAWQRLPDLPTPRGGLGAALAGTRVVVAGGEDAAKVFPEVEAFDLQAGRWSALPPMVTPRHGLGAAAMGNQFLALVGGTRAGVGPSAVTEALPLA
jgi:N-acetylneuraminic acid mutarotase